jgi:uncharacterized membrane protein
MPQSDDLSATAPVGESSTARPAPDRPGSGRLGALDLLRGLVISLMAIDHASYFVAKRHPGEFWGVPLPVYSDAAAFLTRLVTHTAAPGFCLLMGASMILLAESRRRAGWSESRLRRYFITRGFLLILLQLFVENPAWLLGTVQTTPVSVEPPGGGGSVMLHFGVLYALGASMICCAFLLRVPSAILALLGTAAVVATQLLTPAAEQAHELFSPVTRLLLVAGHSGPWQVFYPLVPWAGVASLGVILGRALAQDSRRTMRALAPLGAAAVVLFVVLRAAGGFGNIHPAVGPGWIDFLNVTKYPPALTFLLLTLGVDLLLLSAFAAGQAERRAWAGPLLLFGQTALFFYVVHLYVYALIGLAFPHGTSLGVMYAAWALGLGVLFPLCRTYRTFKRGTPLDSVWRLF